MELLWAGGLVLACHAERAWAARRADEGREDRLQAARLHRQHVHGGHGRLPRDPLVPGPAHRRAGEGRPCPPLPSLCPPYQRHSFPLQNVSGKNAAPRVTTAFPRQACWYILAPMQPVFTSEYRLMFSSSLLVVRTTGSLLQPVRPAAGYATTSAAFKLFLGSVYIAFPHLRRHATKDHNCTCDQVWLPCCRRYLTFDDAHPIGLSGMFVRSRSESGLSGLFGV